MSIEQKVKQALSNKMVKGLGEGLVTDAFNALPSMPVHATSIAYAVKMLKDNETIFENVNWPMAHEAIFRTNGKESEKTDEAGLVRRIPIDPDMVMNLIKNEEAIEAVKAELETLKAEKAEKPARATKEKSHKATWAELLGL